MSKECWHLPRCQNLIEQIEKTEAAKKEFGPKINDCADVAKLYQLSKEAGQVQHHLENLHQQRLRINPCETCPLANL